MIRFRAEGSISGMIYAQNVYINIIISCRGGRVNEKINSSWL